MNGGFRLGKLFGIEITVDPSWILIFLLVTWSLAASVFPRLLPNQQPVVWWGSAVLASLLFFASVLSHELAHSLVARARGLPIRRITLFLFGGVSDLEKEPESPGTEFLMAVVGPATSIILGLTFLFLANQLFGGITSSIITPNGGTSQLSPFQALLLWLGTVNVIVGLFNLVPGFPLDGGRILRSIIWGITNNLKIASRIATLAGQTFGYLFVLIGVVMVFGVNVPFFGTGLVGGIWIASIGWFLANAASRSYEQVLLKDLLKDKPVADLMQNNITVVSPDLSISQLVDKYMIGTDKHVFPVIKDGKLDGLICLEDIQTIPRQQWEKVTVAQAMTPFKKLNTVSPQQGLDEALNKIIQSDIGQIPVIKDNKLLGMLSRRDILLWFTLKAQEEGMEQLKG